LQQRMTEGKRGVLSPKSPWNMKRTPVRGGEMERCRHLYRGKKADLGLRGEKKKQQDTLESGKRTAGRRGDATERARKVIAKRSYGTRERKMTGRSASKEKGTPIGKEGTNTRVIAGRSPPWKIPCIFAKGRTEYLIRGGREDARGLWNIYLSRRRGKKRKQP